MEDVVQLNDVCWIQSVACRTKGKCEKEKKPFIGRFLSNESRRGPEPGRVEVARCVGGYGSGTVAHLL